MESLGLNELTTITPVIEIDFVDFARLLTHITPALYN